jgi:hypothetical protein
MDLPNYVNVFMDFMQTYQPVLDSSVKFGTSAFAIGSSVVKVLQQGKQLTTVAVGKKKTQTRSAAGTRKPARVKTGTSERIAVKKNVAIVVEVSRPAVQDAARFLQRKKMDANLIVVTRIKKQGQSAEGLDEDDPKVWFEMVQEFSTAIDAIKREMGAVHMHIFMATPVALAFGLGAVWGTVDEATIYHWNSREYKRVLEIRRDLRFQPRK